MARPQQPHGSILVIEDDGGVRESLAEVLGMEGYRVHGCADGQEALGYLQSAPLPGLILLDLMMPVMNGWVFRDQQQQERLLSSVPVVLMSGVDDVAEQAAALGTVAYLRKPIDIEELLDTVARYCR
jgi:CheY-like chemotaxis protein